MMQDRQLVAAVVVALCGSVLLTVPAVGTGAVAPPQIDAASQVENGSNATDAAMGSQITSFMQASAVEANASAESGMWETAVESAADPDNRVTSRVAQLDRRLERLRTRTERLETRRADGTIPEIAYTARASALQAQLQAVRSEIDRTDRTAQRLGANSSALEQLRTRAANATGPEMATSARALVSLDRRSPPGLSVGDLGAGDRSELPADAGSGPGSVRSNATNASGRPTPEAAGDSDDPEPEPTLTATTEPPVSDGDGTPARPPSTPEDAPSAPATEEAPAPSTPPSDGAPPTPATDQTPPTDRAPGSTPREADRPERSPASESGADARDGDPNLLVARALELVRSIR